MKLIEFKNKNWLLKIDLEGGRIYELSKEGEKILGTYERIDEKIGNTHVCIPNFAREGGTIWGWWLTDPLEIRDGN